MIVIAVNILFMCSYSDRQKLCIDNNNNNNNTTNNNDDNNNYPVLLPNAANIEI